MIQRDMQLLFGVPRALRIARKKMRAPFSAIAVCFLLICALSCHGIPRLIKLQSKVIRDSGRCCSVQRLFNEALMWSSRYEGVVNAGMQNFGRGRLRLRGGMILEPWETENLDFKPDTINVTDDVMRTWSKEKEDEFALMCEKELEAHWENQRVQRERDVANGDIGCNYVADDEYCVRGVDGNIYKFKYDPQPFGISGPNTQRRRMPFAVDKVNPEALAQIAEDLDRRDKERIRTGQELCAEADRQMALLEALAWYNGSKRTKFEDGKVSWCPENQSSIHSVEAIANFSRRFELFADSEEISSTEDFSSDDAFPDILQSDDIPFSNSSTPYRYDGEAVPKHLVPDFSRYGHPTSSILGCHEYLSEGFCWDDIGEELRSCVWRGKSERVRELLSIGADPNYRTVYAGWRPIHYAAWNDRPSIAMLLINAGALKDVQNDHGQTALHLAANRASNRCISALLDSGCNPNLRHMEGLLPLEVAHKMMLCSEYPASLDVKETVLLLANATDDQDARQAALEDAEDRWSPMPGFGS